MTTPAQAGRSSLRIISRIALGLIGLAIVAKLVQSAGPDRVAAILWQAGRWLPLILALEVFQVTTDFLALRSILGDGWKEIPAPTWLRSSSIAYAMMTLLPAGRAAGEVTRGALFSKYLGAARAATTSTRLQAAYLGANAALSLMACCVVTSRFGFKTPLALFLAINVVFQVLIASGLLAILRAARLGRWLNHMRMRFVPGAVESPPLDPEERKRVPWRAWLICCSGRGAQLVQYGIILHAVGGELTVRNAFITHGVHLVGATVGDMVPNQLGVTDAAYRAFAGDLGFATEPARALSIAFLVRIAQITLAATCVLVATLTRHAALRDEPSSSSAGADARS